MHIIINMMTPEEKFNRDMASTLTKIKEEMLYVGEDQIIEHKVQFEVGGYTVDNNETLIVKQLDKLGAINIIREVNFPHDYSQEAHHFHIRVLQPKFNELYKYYIDNKVIKQNNTDQIVIENEIGFLIINSKKINIGSMHNVPFRLLNIMFPFGKPVATDSVFNETNTDRTKYKKNSLSSLEKIDIIKNRLKELQDILKNKKIKICLKFIDSEGTVLMERSD